MRRRKASKLFTFLLNQINTRKRRLKALASLMLIFLLNQINTNR